MPKVSIIMPVYNKEKFLNNSINSVINQTFEDYELIIVDDGSTDNSAKIIDKFCKQDSRVKSICIKNNGVSNARNIGIGCANGEWIQFLDSDDLIEPDYLENVKFYINQDFDIIFSNFNKIDTNNKIVEKVKIDKKGIVSHDELCHDFMEYQYCNGYFGFVSNKLIRKSLIKDNDIFFPNHIKLAEDLYFYTQLYEFTKKCFYSDVSSFKYLQTETNYSNNLNINYLNQIEVQLKIKNWIIKKENLLEYKQFFNNRIRNYACYSLFDAQERNLDFNKIYKSIISDIEIMKCISFDDISFLDRMLSFGLIHKNLKLIEFILKLRKVIRYIYRKLK